MIDIYVGYSPPQPIALTLSTLTAEQDDVISEAIGALRDEGYAYQVHVPMEKYRSDGPGRPMVYHWRVPLFESVLTYRKLSEVASLLWELLTAVPDYRVTYAGGYPDAWVQSFLTEVS